MDIVGFLSGNSMVDRIEAAKESIPALNHKQQAGQDLVEYKYTLDETAIPDEPNEEVEIHCRIKRNDAVEATPKYGRYLGNQTDEIIRYCVNNLHYVIPYKIGDRDEELELEVSRIQSNIISGSADGDYLNAIFSIFSPELGGNSKRTTKPITNRAQADVDQITSLGEFFTKYKSAFQWRVNAEGAYNLYASKAPILMEDAHDLDRIVSFDDEDVPTESIKDDLKVKKEHIKLFTYGGRVVVNQAKMIEFLAGQNIITHTEGNNYTFKNKIPENLRAKIEELLVPVEDDADDALMVDKATLLEDLTEHIIDLIYSLADKYTVYYFFDENKKLQSFIDYPPIRVATSGLGGGGAMRSDNPDEIEYYWSGNLALGIVLGLKPLRYKYEILSTEVGVAARMSVQLMENDFYPTNVPFWKKSNPRKLGEKEKAKTFLFGSSEIIYFKKFKKNPKLEEEGISKKNKPREVVPIVPRLPKLSDQRYKGKGVRKKQKGNSDPRTTVTSGVSLEHGNASKREDAGKVMGKALRKKKFPDANGSKIGATDFSNKLIAEDPFKAAMKENIGADGKVLTDQEWCHLYGHGDGGSEVYRNFVSGSKHCNTEQLAIESGQRTNKPDDLTAKVTAYLYTEDADEDWPLASWMRYKIYYDVSDVDIPDDSPLVNYDLNGKIKVLDHIYDAQSQSFDYNEYKILSNTVRRAIAQVNATYDGFEEDMNMKLQVKLTEMDDEDDIAIIKALIGKEDHKELKYKFEIQVMGVIGSRMRIHSGPFFNV
ncbi:MAG: hypothetical protein JXR03_13105 [Cyclobacteriaceae bacterium]